MVIGNYVCLHITRYVMDLAMGRVRVIQVKVSCVFRKKLVVFIICMSKGLILAQIPVKHDWLAMLC